MGKCIFPRAPRKRHSPAEISVSTLWDWVEEQANPTRLLNLQSRAIVNPCSSKYVHLRGFVRATTESINPPPQDAVFFLFLIWLCWVLVVAHRLCDLHCGVWGLQLQHVRSSSLNRDWTWAPSVGSGESSLSHWATREVTRWCLHYPGQATSGCDRKWSHNLKGLKE